MPAEITDDFIAVLSDAQQRIYERVNLITYGTAISNPMAALNVHVRPRIAPDGYHVCVPHISSLEDIGIESSEIPPFFRDILLKVFKENKRDFARLRTLFVDNLPHWQIHLPTVYLLLQIAIREGGHSVWTKQRFDVRNKISKTESLAGKWIDAPPAFSPELWKEMRLLTELAYFYIRMDTERVEADTGFKVRVIQQLLSKFQQLTLSQQRIMVFRILLWQLKEDLVNSQHSVC